MTHKVKIFENVFPHSSIGHRSMFRDQIWWKLAVTKLPKGRVDYSKKLALRGTRPSPHFAQNGRLGPKFSDRCHPLTCPRILNLVRISCALPDFFAHIFVSPGDAPAIITQYVAWMERQFNACQTPRSMFPSIFNSFPVIRTASAKKSQFSRTAAHIFVAPGDVDVPASITQYVA